MLMEKDESSLCSVSANQCGPVLLWYILTSPLAAVSLLQRNKKIHVSSFVTIFTRFVGRLGVNDLIKKKKKKMNVEKLMN